jgi:hypothetical protein
MICLSWNCRGLGNLQTVRALYQLVRAKKPNLIFLMKTKTMQSKMDRIKMKLGFDRAFVVDCKGKNGGLIFLWNLDTQVDIQNHSRRHINVVVQSGSQGGFWNLAGFFGHPNVATRVEAWALLRDLAKLVMSAKKCIFGPLNLH